MSNLLASAAVSFPSLDSRAHKVLTATRARKVTRVFKETKVSLVMLAPRALPATLVRLHPLVCDSHTLYVRRFA